MDANLALRLRVALPRPGRAASTRVHLGTSEVVLEAVRGGHCLLWTNGKQSKRFVLGVPDRGALTLELRAPKYPVRVVPRESIAIGPGGRVAGYLQVALTPTLTWSERQGAAGEVLVELPPEDQTAEWEERGGFVLHASSPWFVRFPLRNGEPRAIVPIRMVNRTASVQMPPFVEVALRTDELTALRGSVVVAPRRLRWTGSRVEVGARGKAGRGVTA